MLEEMLREHELTGELIHEIDCDSEDAGDVTGLPTIQICGQSIVGLPEENMLDQALWMLRVKPCFTENQ